MKSIGVNARPAYTRDNTYRRVYQVIGHDFKSTSRGLCEACVTEGELLDQESIGTKYAGGLLRIRERRDGVGLIIYGGQVMG